MGSYLLIKHAIRLNSIEQFRTVQNRQNSSGRHGRHASHGRHARHARCARHAISTMGATCAMYDSMSTPNMHSKNNRAAISQKPSHPPNCSRGSRNPWSKTCLPQPEERWLQRIQFVSCLRHICASPVRAMGERYIQEVSVPGYGRHD